MIEIVGTIKNAVNCGCYEIEAVPAPVQSGDCACDEYPPSRKPQEGTPRVQIGSERSFAIRVEDALLKKWFAGRQPQFYFRVYLNGQLERSTARTSVWTGRTRGKLVIDLCAPEPPPPCGKVCGKVTDCRGHPLAGVRVYVFDVDLNDATSLGTSALPAQGNDTKPQRTRKVGTPLGETVTNDCGEYCLCYKRQDYAANEIDTADIRVIVGTPAGQPLRLLQESDIRFNAPASLTVDLKVPGSALDGCGEFMDYHKRLAQLGCDTPDERAALTDQQLAFASNEAGIPLEHLLLVRQAYQLDKEFIRPLESLPDHILPQIFYGLLREGVTGSFPDWARRYHGSAWNGVYLGDKLASLIDAAIKGCVIDRSLGLPPGPANTKLVGLLIWTFSFVYALTTPLLPNRSSWFGLLSVIWTWPADAPKFVRFELAWLRYGAGQAMWDDLAPNLSASDLGKLKDLVKLAEISGFYAPAVSLFMSDETALVAAAGSDTQWSAYFTPASVSPSPAGVVFADYALEVLQRARAYFGSDALDTWVSGVNANNFPPALGLSNSQATQSAQRLSHLTTSAEFAARLAAAGFTSARDVAELRWEDFDLRMQAQGESPNSVQSLYSYTKALETRAVSVATILQLSPVLNSPIDNLPVPFMKTPDLTVLNGVTASMFGSGSSCDCEGRQSVFSPAAYLYALRRFLGNVAGPVGGRDLLDARRPEMKSLQLSYVNTNTALPTIDVNNEVLEDLAATVLNLVGTINTNRQTTLESSELELQYEYENSQVYDAFANGNLVWPWRFPFDLNHNKRRIYLEAISLSREGIQRLVFLNPSVYDLSDARLDFSAEQLQYLTTVSPTSSAYNATRAQLSAPLTMMGKAQIGFQDLYAITKLNAIYKGLTPAAPYINPEVDGSGSAPCDPSSYTLNDAIGSALPLTDDQADRIHRFVRLWRLLPWPVYLLDWAIGAFPLEPSDALFPLKWLGAAESIRQRLKLKPQEVIGFWASLSTQRWEMPFVNTKAIPSPWEQVFRVAIGDLTLAAAARLSGISEQLATELAGATPWTEEVASEFFRYGRLAKAIPGLQPQDIKRYGDLRGFDAFGSPDDTWTAIEEFEVARRSGARLSAILPLYLAPTDPGTTALDRRQMLTTVEDLNVQAQILPGTFELALARFVPEATVSLIAKTLTLYDPTAPDDYASHDNSLAAVLSLPQLSTLSVDLSGLPDNQKDGARKQRILEDLAIQLWEKGIASLLATASGLDPVSARLIADSVKTSGGPTITQALRSLLGDGGNWTGWPAAGVAAPGAQAHFLDGGTIAVPAPMSSTFDAKMLSGGPGDYQVRAKASYKPGGAGAQPEINIGTSQMQLAPDEVAIVQSFTLKDKESTNQSLSLVLISGTACSIDFELVGPSDPAQALAGTRPPAGTRPLAGTRLYSDSAKIDAALEALELMALAGTLATQWKLNAGDLSALFRLQAGSSTFPNFPPTASQRPLKSSDAPGFLAWLEYAQLVAALKLTRGQGRQVLYDTALLAQGLSAQAGATADPIWQGIGVALELEIKYVRDTSGSLVPAPSYAASAAGKLGLTLSDVSTGKGWLKLFDLSRALQEYGVSADQFAAWGGIPILSSDVASLEGAVRTKLTESRSAGEKLRKVVDKIRALKRDVLCDYLLANPPLAPAWMARHTWQTRKDISDYLLTDVEMEPCAQTSRVRFAIAAAQRLVTQALAQSEQLSLNSEQETEWRSIFQLQLWAVRQKILTYPENWLKFGLHLQRSAEFDDLAQALLQGDLTDERAWESLTHYVEQLHALGHLEVVGTCTQQEFDATGAVSVDLFHVVARTPAEPRAYYHRTRVDRAYWTPWQKIELDIDGDQIVPVVHNRQLHLFWLVTDIVAQDKPGVTREDRQISLEDKYKTLRLAWSVLTSKGWRAKMISKDLLSTRFGHYAANAWRKGGDTDNNAYNVYAEMHAWNQAAQDVGTYQLRPTLSREFDVLIELYSPLESTVVSKLDPGLPDWVYQVRDDLVRAGFDSLAADWFALFDAAASAALNELVGEEENGINATIFSPKPDLPLTGSSQTNKAQTVTNTTQESYLFGTFRLTPDNLVEVRSRSTEFYDPTKYLTDIECARTAVGLDSAVAWGGAFEFDDGSIELFTGGSFQTILADAGVPARVVVTRQEAVPSQTDPVFCRVKNRQFFAFKEMVPLPPVSVRAGKDLQLYYAAPRSQGISVEVSSAFQTTPREYVTVAGGSTPLAPTTMQRVGYGAVLSDRFAGSIANFLATSSGIGWRFALAHHPQSIELLRAVNAGLDHLYTRETQNNARAATGSMTVPFDFDQDYDPVMPWVDLAHLPKDELEFKVDEAYAIHNWELLCHGPIMIAQQLMKVGQFDDARNWIANVFNPRDPDVFGTPPHPENYWVFKPFVDLVAGTGVDDFQHLNPDGSGDPYLRTVFRGLIKQWRLNPYNPHAVAAFRPQAYQLAAIFLYVENLIAWGDSLFAAPSAELVEEAARRYEEAEHVIGRPPVSTGAIRYDAAALSVAQLDSGQALATVDLENAFSVGDGPSPQVEDVFLPDLAIGYFCLPPNPRIKELRDKIQDRLFKAHHCLDLLGNPRTLPLYDPPIDPALLADAAMAGLNVSQAVMDAYTPRPNYRLRTLLALAKGIVQQSTALGSALLSASEKRDAESLSLLKATHETKLQESASAVRKLQVEDAQASVKALERTLRTVEFRKEFYESREFMNAEETAQIELSLVATIFRIIGQALNTAASAAGAIPDITIGVAGWAGSPVTVAMTGGANASRVPAGLGVAMSAVGDMMGTLSSIAGSMGSYRRRKEDWEFQAGSAKLEAVQIGAQILGAQIRQTIAERELANHETQVEQSKEELDFVRTKQTSVGLYEWLAADIGASYYRAFQLGHAVALQAQRALQDELGTDERYIGYSYWDGTRNGLQAGERLMGDLLAMEAQYHAKNARPVPKLINVSLAQVDPIALSELKVNGACDFELPEAYWNKHAPGLYFCRFSTVSVSVPAVVGPFNGVHGRLSIVGASYRKDPSLLDSGGDPTADTYSRQGPDDTRFVDQFPRPGDFIVLSTGVRDTGLGGDEQREDRYRPFEYLGAASSWRLEISQRDNAFDLSTVSDVVLHVEIMAKDGGEPLRDAARKALANVSPEEGFLVNLRQQVAGQWQALKSGNTVALDFKPQLSGWQPNRIGRKLASLQVAVVLRTNKRPETDPANPKTTATVTLGLPSSFPSGLFGPFDVTFEVPDDGGLWFGINPQSVDLTGVANDLLFEALSSESWTITFSPGAGMVADNLDTVILALMWTLDGSP
jgi:receptor-binding and translocation channel-forming TcA subunit of Tc toxin/neuraminidase-like protein/ABC toxin-like protein